jgi:hypothetical protein
MSTERTQLITPAVASATAVHVAVALTTVAQTVTTGITSPDVYRCLCVKGNQASVAGSVVLTGIDWSGAVQSDTFTLAGAAIVPGVKPLKTLTSIALPVLAAAGDTVSVGWIDKFGLYGTLTAGADLLLTERAVSGATEFTIEANGTVNTTYNTVTATITAGDRLRWTYLATLLAPTGFVTLATFAARYEVTIPVADETRVLALLGDACGLVSDLTGIDYDTVAAPTSVVAVICAVVRRAYENPAGLQSETIGDYTWRGNAALTPGLYLTAEETRIVLRAAGKLGAGSINLSSHLPSPAPLYWTGTEDTL